MSARWFFVRFASAKAALKPRTCIHAPAGAEVEGVPEDGGVIKGGTQEEEAATEPRKIVLETAPLDPRFPSSNVARACYTYYNLAHRCRAEHGEGSAECQAYTKKYRSICPDEWIQRWEELREEGRWFGKY